MRAPTRTSRRSAHAFPNITAVRVACACVSEARRRRKPSDLPLPASGEAASPPSGSVGHSDGVAVGDGHPWRNADHEDGALAELSSAALQEVRAAIGSPPPAACAGSSGLALAVGGSAAHSGQGSYTAQRGQGLCITYGDLNAVANDIASRFLSEHVVDSCSSALGSLSPEPRGSSAPSGSIASRPQLSSEECCIVAVLLPRVSWHIFAAQLAALKSGAGVLMLDVNLPDAALRYQISDAKPCAILTLKSYLARRAAQRSTERPDSADASHAHARAPDGVDSSGPGAEVVRDYLRSQLGIASSDHRGELAQSAGGPRSGALSGDVTSMVKPVIIDLFDGPLDAPLEGSATAAADFRHLSVPPDAVFVGRHRSTNYRPPCQSSKTALSSALAMVIYTSGSTGQPKAVLCEHGGYVSYIFDYGNYMNLLVNYDTHAQMASLSFDASLEEIYGAFVSALTLAVFTDAQIRSGPDLVPMIRMEAVTVASLVLYWVKFGAV